MSPERLAPTTPATVWARLGLLRLILALLVATGHYIDWFVYEPPLTLKFLEKFGGTAAVVSFLVISGFSISASLERDPRDFYWRRFLRIYPTYILAIVFAAALELFFGGHFSAPYHHFESRGTLANVGNLIFLQTFLVKPVDFDGPIWSLAVEVFLYALAPWLIRLSPKNLLGIAAVSALCFLLPKRNDLGLLYLAISKFNALIYAWPWILGMVIWKLDRHGEDRLQCILLGISGALIAQLGPLTSGGYAAASFAAALSCILIPAKASASSRFKKLGDLAGDISYPAYLIHLPLLIFLCSLNLSQSAALNYAAILIMSTILAVVWEPWSRHQLSLLSRSVRK